MYSIWGCLSFFMLITGRHLRQFYKFRAIVHGVCGTLILALTILSISFAEKGSFNEGIEDRLNHYQFGELLEYSVISITSFGYLLKALIYIFGCMTGVKTAQWRIIWLLKHLHKLFGKILILFSIWTMFAGLFSYEE